MGGLFKTDMNTILEKVIEGIGVKKKKGTGRKKISNNLSYYNGFAIEPEISLDFRTKYIDGIDAHESVKMYFIDCTSSIKELTNGHLLSKSLQEKFYKKVNLFYSKNFSVGSDAYSSGGFHMHIFDKKIYEIIEKLGREERKKRNEEEKRFLRMKRKIGKKFAKPEENIKRIDCLSLIDRKESEEKEKRKYKEGLLFENFYNCPLFTRRYRNKILKRKAWSTSKRAIDSNKKTCLVNLRNFKSYGKSVEFRLNDVFDYRIVAYYIACAYAADKGIRLYDIKDEKLKEYAYEGEQWKKTELSGKDIHFSKCDGYPLTKETKAILAKNIAILISLLGKMGHMKYAIWLFTYGKDFLK